MNAAAAMIESEPERTVDSTLLGTLCVRESQVFAFDHGFLGFPEARSFALVRARQEGLFWLQSTDFEALTFLAADPFNFVDEYAVELGHAELGDLASENPSELLVLTVLTLPRRPTESATANLQGPVALNLPLRRGRQIVLQDSPYGVRHPVELPGRSVD